MARTQFTGTISNQIGTDAGLIEYSITDSEIVHIPVVVEGANFADLSLYDITITAVEGDNTGSGRPTQIRQMMSNIRDIPIYDVADNSFTMILDANNLLVAADPPATAQIASNPLPQPGAPIYWYISILLNEKDNTLVTRQDGTTMIGSRTVTEIGRGWIEIVYSPLTQPVVFA